MEEEEKQKSIKKKEYNFQLKEEIELPQESIEVEDFLIKLKEFDSTYRCEKLLIEGELMESVIYVTTKGDRQAQVEKINFRHFLSITDSNISQDCKFDLDISQIKYKFKENLQKRLIATMDFKLIVWTMQFNSTKNSLQPTNLKTRKLILDKFLTRKKFGVLVEQKLNLTGQFQKVFDLNSKLINFKSKKMKDKILFKGLIEHEVLALNQEGEVKHLEFKREIEETAHFSQISPEVELIVKGEIKDLEFIKLAKQLKVMMVIQAVVTAYQEVVVSVYTDASGQKGKLIKAKQARNNLQEKWMIENEFELTMTYRDLIEIKGRVVTVQTELIDNKVIVSGQLVYDLYYIDQQGKEKRERFNSNFHKLLPCSSAKADLLLDYELQINQLQSELKENQLNIKVILVFKGRLEEELITQVITKEFEYLQQSSLENFLVKKVLEIGQEKFLVPFEFYLARYAKLIKEVKIEFVNTKSKLLNESFLFSCQLKIIINFIDKKDTEQEIIKTKNIYKLFTIQVELDSASLQLIPKVKHIESELNDSGEKLSLKGVLCLDYQILARSKLSILTKMISREE